RPSLHRRVTEIVGADNVTRVPQQAQRSLIPPVVEHEVIRGLEVDRLIGRRVPRVDLGGVARARRNGREVRTGPVQGLQLVVVVLISDEQDPTAARRGPDIGQQRLDPPRPPQNGHQNAWIHTDSPLRVRTTPLPVRPQLPTGERSRVRPGVRAKSEGGPNLTPPLDRPNTFCIITVRVGYATPIPCIWLPGPSLTSSSA